jgi:DNA repair protein RecN (Recombination protein N)
MLARLSIRDIVLIERLDIDFAAGLSVLTGETGAGKSILLDAFALALGARGDAALVRRGVEQGQVTAVFDVSRDHPAWTVLSNNDIAVEEALLLRRVQFADGRTRAFVNDQPVSVQVLKALGAALVEIHGQHDDRALVDIAVHRTLLDAYQGLDREAAAVAGAWTVWREAAAAVTAHRARVEECARQADFLRHAVDELTRLAPQAGEEGRLADRRAAMIQAEKVAGDLRDAHQTLCGSPSPLPALSAAVRRLERRVPQAPSLLEPAVRSLDAALLALEDARGQLEAAVRAASIDSGELERIEERLFALRAASRKHNVMVDGLAALAARYAADLAALEAGAEQLAALDRSARSAEETYAHVAQVLSQARVRAARSLEQAVNPELKPLRLERARFAVDIRSDPTTTGPEGFDRVEFWVETNPGSRPGPLMKVASGGELARFLLALKVVLADRGSAPTLIFDEVDTGAGGAVAAAIGQRLARLAGRVQVVAVTHAPQVAARADRHYLITKAVLDRGKRVATRVIEVEADGRREEIARMLAGAEITEEARAAAERLIRTTS